MSVLKLERNHQDLLSNSADLMLFLLIKTQKVDISFFFLARYYIYDLKTWKMIPEQSLVFNISITSHNLKCFPQILQLRQQK